MKATTAALALAALAGSTSAKPIDASFVAMAEAQEQPSQVNHNVVMENHPADAKLQRRGESRGRDLIKKMRSKRNNLLNGITGKKPGQPNQSDLVGNLVGGAGVGQLAGSVANTPISSLTASHPVAGKLSETLLGDTSVGGLANEVSKNQMLKEATGGDLPLDRLTEDLTGDANLKAIAGGRDAPAKSLLDDPMLSGLAKGVVGDVPTGKVVGGVSDDANGNHLLGGVGGNTVKGNLIGGVTSDGQVGDGFDIDPLTGMLQGTTGKLGLEGITGGLGLNRAVDAPKPAAKPATSSNKAAQDNNKAAQAKAAPADKAQGAAQGGHYPVPGEQPAPVPENVASVDTPESAAPETGPTEEEVAATIDMLDAAELEAEIMSTAEGNYYPVPGDQPASVPENVAPVDEPESSAPAEAPKDAAQEPVPENIAPVDEPQSSTPAQVPEYEEEVDPVPENIAPVDEPESSAPAEAPKDAAQEPVPENIAPVDEPQSSTSAEVPEYDDEVDPVPENIAPVDVPGAAASEAPVSEMDDPAIAGDVVEGNAYPVPQDPPNMVSTPEPGTSAAVDVAKAEEAEEELTNEFVTEGNKPSANAEEIDSILNTYGGNPDDINMSSVDLSSVDLEDAELGSLEGKDLSNLDVESLDAESRKELLAALLTSYGFNPDELKMDSLVADGEGSVDLLKPMLGGIDGSGDLDGLLGTTFDQEGHAYSNGPAGDLSNVDFTNTAPVDEPASEEKTANYYPVPDVRARALDGSLAGNLGNLDFTKLDLSGLDLADSGLEGLDLTKVDYESLDAASRQNVLIKTFQEFGLDLSELDMDLLTEESDEGVDFFEAAMGGIAGDGDIETLIGQVFGAEVDGVAGAYFENVVSNTRKAGEAIVHGPVDLTTLDLSGVDPNRFDPMALEELLRNNFVMEKAS